MIGNEELECVVLLYLQSLGYYIYSSTLKSDTKTYETVMIKNDGSHLCYPQIKQGLQLLPHKYVGNIAATLDITGYPLSQFYKFSKISAPKFGAVFICRST